MPPPRLATEARSGSPEPGWPSRARSANTRHPVGRPHTPPADRMYATDLRQKRRQTASSLNAPLGGGIIMYNNTTFILTTSFQDKMAISRY